MIVRTFAKGVLSRALYLHPFYITRPRLWSAQLWEIDARVALNLARRFCYVRIPKCGNTAVTSTLYYHETGRQPARGLPPPKRSFARPSALPRFTPAALDGLYCFSFVRNPYHRLLSAYLSKLVARENRNAEYRDVARTVRRRYGAGELSFGAFCAYLAAEGPYADPHWYPQYRYLEALGARRLDFLGRVERMNEDIAQVVQAIYGRADERTYKIGPTTGAASRIRQFYDDATRRIVRELYREDFERFGYDPALPD